MNDDRPICGQHADETTRTEADCAENHTKRWFHAKDAAQVEQWINSDRDVFDTDSDMVYRCNPVQQGSTHVTYAISVAGGTIYSLHFTNFLLEGPEFEPVTEDEEAAIIASILGTN